MRSRSQILKTTISAALVIFSSGALAAAGRPAENPVDEIKRVENSVRVMEEMMGIPEKSIPASLLRNAAGIAILPDVIKAAYVVGGRYGKGILSVRGEDGLWSNPSFISLKGGSIGWQAGVQSADIILVFKTRRSVNNITEGKFTLGADAGLAAGPLGRQAEASTDADLKAEIYSYSRSRGLYAGLSIQGASLAIDWEANQKFYAVEGIAPRKIFEDKDIKAPEVVESLKSILEKYSR